MQDGGLMFVPLTPEQAAIVRQAQAAALQAQAQVQTIVSVLSAGHVPPGSVLERVDERGLVFAEVPGAA
jgi:hypothetical protein